MPEYISREAALDAISEWLMKALHPESMSIYSEGERAAYRTALSEIADIPAADVRPVVRGKWIPDYDYAEYDFDGTTPLSEPRKFQDGWQCSLCGGYSPSETNFCPNCGARMEES